MSVDEAIGRLKTFEERIKSKKKEKHSKIKINYCLQNTTITVEDITMMIKEEEDTFHHIAEIMTIIDNMEKKKLKLEIDNHVLQAVVLLEMFGQVSLADLVVDDENLLIETEIPNVDDIDVDKDAEKICSYSRVFRFCFGLLQSRMSNTSDKGTTFGDGAARVELYSINVAATFEVSLTTVGDLQKLINDIDAGKHDELLSELTNEDHMETLEALGSICNSIKVDRNNADVIPYKVSYADDSINLNVNESTIPSDHIVQSVYINKSTSYAGVASRSVKDQPNVNSNFRTLVADLVFVGVNIFIPSKVVEKVSTRFEHTLYGYFIGKRMAFPVVEYYARNNWVKHRLKRIMMNSKGFFFFKFDSWAGLEAVLEGGP
ncbi:hypothetical protein Tco_0802671 [Tanacetum coccineum]|uniref:DUF4283 domain-containing protein n=1 Tax=Tanacetum coccineum TaxID=301880 RepID=A0ABQ5A3M9_9ASTR